MDCSSCPLDCTVGNRNSNSSRRVCGGRCPRVSIAAHADRGRRPRESIAVSTGDVGNSNRRRTEKPDARWHLAQAQSLLARNVSASSDSSSVVLLLSLGSKNRRSNLVVIFLSTQEPCRSERTSLTTTHIAKTDHCYGHLNSLLMGAMG